TLSAQKLGVWINPLANSLYRERLSVNLEAPDLSGTANLSHDPGFHMPFNDKAKHQKPPDT
ncbi:hypothetical protein, partial [Arthrobacter sp. 08Y14]|uniref:hypothetical protein n=1 Tax=Arthrobacter sp. 08Y14 TaxID=2058885 RepID=UPI001CA550C5